MQQRFKAFLIRDWAPRDRTTAAELIAQVLAEYGLAWEPTGADRDVVEVETFYQQVGGAFWVIEQDNIVVGTAAYYPVKRGHNAVEIRKMYLSSSVRGQGLGRYLLQLLETTIAQSGFELIWVETASVLATAVHLYESHGYEAATGVETPRCDRIYCKRLISNTALD